MRRRNRTSLIAVMLAAGLTAMTQHVAHADAYGESPVRAFEYTFKGVTVKVPTGFTFGHRIVGSDLRITDEFAGITGFGPAIVQSPFCNWRIDFQYEDEAGKVYDTDRGPVNNSCNKYDIERVGGGKRTLPSYGKACAIFFVNGSEEGRQCHYVVKKS